MSAAGWIGVDLDGTLAHYDHWRGPDHIGAPIPAMVERVRRWLSDGKEVRIFTARVWSHPNNADAFREVEERVRPAIDRFCVEQFGRNLRATCVKDYEMIELWDDRAIQVIPNTGRTIADELASVRSAHEGKAAGR